ncbi:hypothetical protein [Halochromatium roseum]|uniref:hypothetical protein n=1 Tax=Halochromatium roseum TaxID=391920 RepID=UPI001913E5BE|nr:hypothetical protein [Halochromatium roseum]MBK5941672.1 hypothetical protein [Halochromatium roseum]
MGKRHAALGIKQTIRLEWMQRAANLRLAGLDKQRIRADLHEYLAERRGSGQEGMRSDQGRAFVVSCLMRTWVSPDPALVRLRDALLRVLAEQPALGLAAHWAMISAAYPFWWSVARQTGRLLALQEQVTWAQILNRLREDYGDRQSVSRYGRYVVRSFVAWGVLADTASRGCYELTTPLAIPNADLCALLFEATLHAMPEAKAELGLLLANPGFFPFRLPWVSGDVIAQQSDRMEVVRSGSEADLLLLSPGFS